MIAIALNMLTWVVLVGSVKIPGFFSPRNFSRTKNNFQGQPTKVSAPLKVNILLWDPQNYQLNGKKYVKYLIKNNVINFPGLFRNMFLNSTLLEKGI